MRAGSRAGRWRGGAHVAHAAHGGGRACQGAGPRVVGKISRRRAGCGARRGKATGKIGGRRRTGTHPAHICRHAAPHAERTASGRGGGGGIVPWDRPSTLPIRTAVCPPDWRPRATASARRRSCPDRRSPCLPSGMRTQTYGSLAESIFAPALFWPARQALGSRALVV